jgi:hypothetical protein
MDKCDYFLLGAGWPSLLYVSKLPLKKLSYKIAALDEKHCNKLGCLLRSEIANGHKFDTAKSRFLFSGNEGSAQYVLKLLRDNITRWYLKRTNNYNLTEYLRFRGNCFHRSRKRYFEVIGKLYVEEF